GGRRNDERRLLRPGIRRHDDAAAHTRHARDGPYLQRGALTVRGNGREIERGRGRQRCRGLNRVHRLRRAEERIRRIADARDQIRFFYDEELGGQKLLRGQGVGIAGQRELVVAEAERWEIGKGAAEARRV